MKDSGILKYLAVLLIGGVVAAWGGELTKGGEAGDSVRISEKDESDAFYFTAPPRSSHLRYVKYQVSYPTVFLEKPEEYSAEVARLDVLFRESKYVQSQMKFRDWSDAAHWLGVFLEEPREWHRLAVPTRVARVIPGASHYLVSGCARQHFLVAQREDVLYFLPWELNQLLWDCGMKFDNSNVTKWARVLTFLLVGAREFGLVLQQDEVLQSEEFRQKRKAILRGEKPFFPTFEIESLAVDTAREKYTEEWRRGIPGLVREVGVHFRIRSFHGEILVRTIAGHDKDGVYVIPVEILGDSPGYGGGGPADLWRNRGRARTDFGP